MREKARDGARWRKVPRFGRKCILEHIIISHLFRIIISLISCVQRKKIKKKQIDLKMMFFEIRDSVRWFEPSFFVCFNLVFVVLRWNL